MEQFELDELCEKVEIETLDRSKGSFKRALWYGGKGYFSSKLGDGKGLRKALRNAPKEILVKGLSKAAIAPLALIPGVSEITNVFAEQAIKFSFSIVRSFADLIIDESIDKTKEVIKSRNFFKKTPVKPEEGLRKEIKQEVKKMQKENALLVIDRNLVKLRDANQKAEKMIEKLMKVITSDPNNQERKMEAVYEALRAMAEAEYYVEKIIGLVTHMDLTLSKLEGDLEELSNIVADTQQSVQQYIKLVIK